mgnify:CR=1 FL=1
MLRKCATLPPDDRECHNAGDGIPRLILLRLEPPLIERDLHCLVSAFAAAGLEDINLAHGPLGVDAHADLERDAGAVG